MCHQTPDVRAAAHAPPRAAPGELPEGHQHVFYSPHFDDVVLSVGGLVASLRGAGRDVTIVTVFAGASDPSQYTAFARHLHAKWRTPDPHTERMREDNDALRLLGVERTERWDLLEAPYRCSPAGDPLYSSYEQLRGPISDEDRQTMIDLHSRVSMLAAAHGEDAIYYFPLSLGGHVDHQLLLQAGLHLGALGYRIRFYEDYPYVESYRPRADVTHWRRSAYAIHDDSKIRAALCYRSQLCGLGGSPDAVATRLRGARQRGESGGAQECCWEFDDTALLPGTGDHAPIALPYEPAGATPPRLRGFGRLLATLYFHELVGILPPGTGYCVDVGCGCARHQSAIGAAGYTWIGLDVEPRASEFVAVADAPRLPVQSGIAAAVVVWQVMEYVESPEAVVAEAARVLEAGGVLCGSVSFLEPVHGRTLYGMSPLVMDALLSRHGFADIQITPGINGFTLLLWAWLRRCLGIRTPWVAALLTALWLVPIAGLRFFTSWLWCQLRRGTGHGARWVSERAPLEFAGHVMFLARKTGASVTTGK